MALSLYRQGPARAEVIRWLGAQASAIALTTASKIAFLGWGIGWPALNFTGFSGHAMFAASVYPVVAGMLASGTKRRELTIWAGACVAVLIGISRVMVGAHSPSEVLAGLALGAAVSVVGLKVSARPYAVSPLIVVLVGAWLALMAVLAPMSRTHGWVTQLALELSGHNKPHTREEMLQNRRSSKGSAAQQAPADVVQPEPLAQVVKLASVFVPRHSMGLRLAPMPHAN
jgi:hypothetical protein